MDETQGFGVEETKEAVAKAAPNVDPAREKLVSRALARVKRAKKKHEDAFKRMEVCQELARRGANKEWTGEDSPDATDRKFTVPLLNRHINLVVAQIYAKNPKAYAKRRKRLEYQLWDGTQESLQAAVGTVQAGMQASAQFMAAQTAGMGHNGGPPLDPMGAPMPGPMEPPQIDPNAMAILQEVLEVQEQNLLKDRMGKTLEILWDYFLGEQAAAYKPMFKALVRRAKVNGAGYIKLGYQRDLQKRPEVTAQINDVTDKIAHIERLIAEQREGDIDPDSPSMEDLRLNLEDLQRQEILVVREGPVFDFPKTCHVIPDVKCQNLKTFAGSDEVWQQFDLSGEDIEEIYGVDMDGTGATTYGAKDGGSDTECEEPTYRVYEGWNKRTGQMYVVCEGYKDFLKEPATPDAWTERFWPFYPLVFNECEHEKEIFPLSDVWLGRDMQDEYNRARQGIREHRIQNRPAYAAERGKLDDGDKAKLSNHQSGDVIELNALVGGVKIDDVLQPIKNVGIDPNLYETSTIFDDLTRSIGSAEANFGDPGGATATGSSIAEQSRMSTISENVDELDDVLGALARGFSQLLLLNLGKETVQEIAGPGAVWPDMAETRQEVSKDLSLDIRAGASGRPNRAAELANMERAMPWILQIPGMNPKPFGLKFLELLDIDAEEGIAEGLPSLQAINSMLSKMGVQAQAGAGPQDPTAQGGEGGANQRDTQQNEPQGQPASPAPAPGPSA